MLQSTQEEKQKVKEVKQALKKQNTILPNTLDQIAFKEKVSKFILTGILENEIILSDDYPVYWDYFYVISDNGGKVIKSYIKGDVRALKNDLRKLGYQAEKIYKCDMLKRNMTTK